MRHRTGAALAATLALGIALSGCGGADAPADDGARTAAHAPERVIHVSPTGSGAGDGSAERPFGTVASALETAVAGDVVEIANGTYDESVPIESRSPADAPITIRSAPGADATLDGVEVFGSGVVIEGLSVGGWAIRPGAADVVLRDISSKGAFITSASRVRIEGGEIAGADSIDGLQIKGDDESGQAEDIVIDRLTIRDVTRTADPSAHTECIQFTSGVRIVVRNSTFINCSTQGVFFKEDLGGRIDDVLVENSVFGPLEGFNTLIVEAGATDVRIRANSFAQAPRIRTEPGAGVSVVGNAGTLSACQEGVEYRHNVWTDARCGASDLQADPGFADEGEGDLTLVPGAAAIDRGDPDDYPATDVAGTRRPQGDLPDAGAWESASDGD